MPYTSALPQIGALRLALCLALYACLILPAMATPILSIGNYEADPSGTTMIQVMVSGGDEIAGVNFIFGTGPFSGMPGNPTGTGPLITAVDGITGTIFGGNNAGQTALPGFPARKIKNVVTTDTGTVPADGLLATLILNTTGLATGTYELRVLDMATMGGGGNTNFVLDDASTVIPLGTIGSIHTVFVPPPIIPSPDPPPPDPYPPPDDQPGIPEPSTFVLAALGLIALAAYRWRNAWPEEA